MSIQVQCSHCRKTMSVKDSAAGKRGLCPFCKQEINVPLASPTGATATAQIQVKKGWLGGYTVTYDCPHCATPLTSKLEEAGNHDACPECGAQFVVPGKGEFLKIEAAKEREVQEARAREERERQVRGKAEAERRERQEEQRREQVRLEEEIAEHPFNFPIQYAVNREGMIEYRDRYFEVIHQHLRVNPDLDISEGRLIIKSIQLFKKQVNMSKKEASHEIKETRAYYRQNKPQIQKSRRKGLIAGLVNVGIEASRASHAANLDSALGSIERRKAMFDELLLACDQLIHQVEIKIASGGE